MNSKILRYGSLLVGMIAAMVIILSQSFAFDNNPAAERASTEQSSPDEDSEQSPGAYQTISATSFPASAQINFFQEASCLFEIDLTTGRFIPDHSTPEIPVSRFFSTLLRVIISPNAP